MSTFRRRNSDLLLEARAFRVRASETDADIHRFLSSLDTPRALTVWLLFKNQEHDQLTALDINPAHYPNGYVFRHDYIATNFLAKSSFLRTTFDRKTVAIEKFKKFESLCRETNNRFRRPDLDPQNHGSSVWLLNATKRKISSILGNYSPDEFVDEANWGPGVSTLIKGEEVSAINKFHNERGITRDLYSLTSTWFHVAYPTWHASLSHSYGENWQVMQVGNEIVTVPKNSKTDRVIAIEPGINLWFQKAIGTMIRRRLARRGISLNDQTINQRLAREGSLRRGLESLATVDFSSASDSISSEVVRELLPPNWFQLLDACRCRFGKLDDELIKWEKFSSMGNGFTFELESLIFYAAASAVCEYLGVDESEVSVFGDDVIIPSSAYSLFSEFTGFLGFRVNPSKSYDDGWFRESCGSHYFRGVDCKPLYLKERIRNVEAIYKLANGIRSLAHRYNFNRSCDARFLDCWTHLHIRVPEPLRLKVPREAGDVGFVSNFDEACPARARYGHEGWTYRALTTLAIRKESETTAVLLTRLWQPAVDQMHNNSYALRGRVKRHVTVTVTHQWYNLGPWEH